VNATPKKGFTLEQVTNNTYLCSHHFTSSAYISTKNDQRESRGSELKRSLLRTDAVPSIWPNCPAYLSKLEVVPRNTSLATSDAREEAVRVKNATADEVSSLKELVKKITRLNRDVVTIEQDGVVAFLVLSLREKSPRIDFSVKVDYDLTFQAFCCDVQQTDIYENKTISSVSQLKKIFDELESRFVNMNDPKNIKARIIERIVDKLTASFDEERIHFLAEQLDLTLKKPKGRRYSKSLLATACLIHNISPTCYQQLLDDNLFIGPSAGHINRLTKAINVDLGLSESSSINAEKVKKVWEESLKF
jgi:hypothetical protein